MKKFIRLALIAFLIFGIVNPISAASYTTNGQVVSVASATSSIGTKDIVLELAQGTYKVGYYEFLAHKGVYAESYPGSPSNINQQNTMPWYVASQFQLTTDEVNALKNNSMFKTITTTFDTGPSEFKVMVGTGNAIPTGSGGGTVSGDLSDVLSTGLDLSNFMTLSNVLPVYNNSRVTKISASTNTLNLEGYIFVKDRSITKAADLFREIIFVNEAYPTAQYAYRYQVTATNGGSFLTKNTTLNPSGKYNYSAATYKVSINYGNMKKYDNITYEKMKAGTYRVFIRTSDGVQSAVFPLRDVTLSDGTSLKDSLPSNFSYVNDNSDGKTNLKVTIK